MEIKVAILTIGMALLTCYLVFINRREKSPVEQQSPQKTPSHFSSNKPELSIPIESNRIELDSFLEKRKFEIFREILRRDHIAQQKRQLNKATCLREILEKLMGSQGAAEIFEYYGSVELFSDAYKKFLGHVPEETILECFDEKQLWEPKIEIYEKIKRAILDGNLETIEEPKESDIWIVSIHPDSFSQWVDTNQENIKSLLETIDQNFPRLDQSFKTHHDL